MIMKKMNKCKCGLTFLYRKEEDNEMTAEYWDCPIRAKQKKEIDRRKHNYKAKLVFKRDFFKDLIKGRCSCCHKKIAGDWDRYQLRGNYCVACSIKADKLVSIKKRLRRLTDLLNKGRWDKKAKAFIQSNKEKVAEDIRLLTEEKESVIKSLPQYYDGKLFDE